MTSPPYAYAAALDGHTFALGGEEIKGSICSFEKRRIDSLNGNLFSLRCFSQCSKVHTHMFEKMTVCSKIVHIIDITRSSFFML
jgi:hypothetical protein